MPGQRHRAMLRCKITSKAKAYVGLLFAETQLIFLYFIQQMGLSEPSTAFQGLFNYLLSTSKAMAATSKLKERVLLSRCWMV